MASFGLYRTLYKDATPYQTAEDKHCLKGMLAEIKAPTLVIGGEDDYFYPVRETALGIPNAQLILYKGFGHNALFDNKEQFQRDVLNFLKS